MIACVYVVNILEEAGK